MTTDAEKKPQRRRGRSPNYPGIDLGSAIERARQLYEAHRHHPAPTSTMLETWGFTPTSGAGGVVLAALMRFGLLQDEGRGKDRVARLTQDALAIIRDERDESPDRDRIIKRLALLPPIHREIWAQYGGELPPTDSALRFALVQHRGFTESGADDFIREFRTTVSFARLDSSDTIDSEDGGGQGYEEESIKPPPPPGGNRMPEGTETLTLPIPGSAQWPMLVVPKRMSESAWQQMIAIIQAMKPGIVRDDEPDESDEGDA